MSNERIITGRGGPTTNAGASYQGWVAAVWLARLLKPATRLDNNVVEVRVESREKVDDVEVTFESGKKKLIQAKRRVDTSSETWKKFWRRAGQVLKQDGEREVILALGPDDERWDGLRTALSRAKNARNLEDARQGWRGEAGDCVDDIRNAFSQPEDEEIWAVLKGTYLETASQETLCRWCAEALPSTDSADSSVAANLAELATRKAGSRRIFRSLDLLKDLEEEFSVTFEPAGQGIGAYLQRVSRKFSQLPGNEILAAEIEEVFWWPTLRKPPSDYVVDRFKELGENLGAVAKHPEELLAPKQRTVLIAGAGYGKSSLLFALGKEALSKKLVPVYVSLPTFAQKEAGLLEHIENEVAPETKVAWSTRAGRGELVLLLDGLDEVSQSERGKVNKKIRAFTNQYQLVPWIVAARDPAAASIDMAAEELWVAPLDDEDRLEFYEGYIPDDAREVVQLLDEKPELNRLCHIPLFAALLAGDVATRGTDDLPEGPVELLDRYLERLLRPERYRANVELELSASELREGASCLAFEALEGDSLVFRRYEARRVFERSPDQVLDDLVRAGVLREIQNKVSFVIPTVQEFLAGERLAEEHSERIIEEIQSPERPWGQAVQFSLVMLDEPDRIICEILELQDDAFSRQLRAVARAITWGAKVSRTLRRDVGLRIADFWRKYESPWAVKEDCVRFLVAFYGVCPEPVDDWLTTHGLSYFPASEFCEVADKSVLVEAVKTSVRGKFSISMTVETHPRLREARDEIFRELVTIVVESACDLQERTLWNIALVLSDLGLPVAEEHRIRNLIDQDVLPEESEKFFRMLLKPREFKRLLVDMASSDDPHSFFARQFLLRVLDNSKDFFQVVRDDNISTGLRRGILEHVRRECDDAVRWMRELVDGSSGLVRLEAMATLALMGEEQEYDNLIRELDYSDVEEVSLWCITLAIYDDQDTRQEARKIETDNFTDSELLRIVQSIALPIRCEGVHVWISGGMAGKEREESHPVEPIARTLAEELIERIDSTADSRFEAVKQAASLGISKAEEELAQEIRRKWTEIAQQKEQDNDDDRELANAIRVVPTELMTDYVLRDMVIRGPVNVARAGLGKLTFDGQDELEELLKLHKKRGDGLLRDRIRGSAIEQGVRIVRDKEGRLVRDKGS